MKKTLLSLFLLASLGASAQTTIFEDGFELYDDFAITNVGSWTLIDLDLYGTYGIGTAPNNTTFPNNFGPRSFIVLNPSQTTPPLTSNVSTTSNWTARTGDKHMVCFASAPTPPSTVPVVNNDWLISPQVTLGTGNIVSFWAKPTNATYGAERFKVGISSGNTTTNVTLLNTGNFVTTPANVTWVQYSYNVPASYNGQSVYFSINCVSPDQFGFAVDDFKVVGTPLSTSDFFTQNFSMYPNPANGVVTLSSKNNAAINSVQVTDLNGRIVKSFEANGVSETRINVSDLTTGMYFVTVKTDAGSGSTKLMKN